MKKILIISLMVLIVLFGCINQQPTNNVSSNLSTTPQNNSVITITQPTHAELQMNDTATVLYTLWVDGKVIDTTNATLGNVSGLKRPTYQPLVYHMDLNGNIIKGFVLNTLGMTVNETRKFIVDPTLGYGNWSQKNVITTDRYYNKSLEEDIPRSYFDSRGITNISNGTSFRTPYGSVFIKDMNQENVTIFYVLTRGQEFETNGIPQKVISVNNLTATIEFNLNENQTYHVPNPETGVVGPLKVLNKTNNTITIDTNQELAGKNLVFEVTLLKIN